MDGGNVQKKSVVNLCGPETMLLIKLWSSPAVQQLDVITQGKVPVMNWVAHNMQLRGFNCTPLDIKVRIMDMMCTYRSIKKSFSGHTNWSYYKAVDDVLRRKTTKSIEDTSDAVKSESLDDDDDDEFVEPISLPTKSVEDKLDAVKSESLDDDDDDEFVEPISLPTKSVEDKLDAVKSESLDDDDDDEFVEPISLPKDIVNPMETGLQPVMAVVPNLLNEILLIQKENLRVCEEILQLERKRMDVERKRMELAHQKLEDELNLL